MDGLATLHIYTYIYICVHLKCNPSIPHPQHRKKKKKQKQQQQQHKQINQINQSIHSIGISVEVEVVSCFGMETAQVLRRQSVVMRHLVASPCAAATANANANAASSTSSGPGPHDSDIVIVAACRTAICKAKRGGFKDTRPEDLLEHVLRGVVQRAGTAVAAEEVGDIVVGTVLAPGSTRATECRIAAFHADFPAEVPVRTVNRQCSSGLQAVADVAHAIKAGCYEIGIAAGLESMSTDSITVPALKNPKIESNEDAKNCLLPMGITSENVAELFGITREEQDLAAVRSHKNAAAAAAAGKFKDEIVPVHTQIIDPQTGEKRFAMIAEDDGIRADTSMSILGKLKPAFKRDGSTTAGNSSQVSDGAGAVLLMRRITAKQRGLPILGVFRGFQVVGCNPALMGIGPAVAIPAAVKAAGLQMEDIGLFEINEAFASQFVYSCKALGLDLNKVNVNGGAIAFGHPLGATGARCVATLLHEMRKRGQGCRFGVVSMCIGSGMGAAAVFENENNFKADPSSKF